jgi:hypothetical protein
MKIMKQLALAAATLILILGLALASNALLDRHLFGDSACVDARGSWANWPWPNVPTLSPPCPNVAAEPSQPAEKQ